MARAGAGPLLSRRNVKLDSFLKRHTERAVYERIRASEPCVVVSDGVRWRKKKAYMHVVLSDECVYVTEYAPRTLTAAVSFRCVRDIELINDLPDFLRGKQREVSQHIRITYVAEKPAGKGSDWLRGGREGLPPAAPPPSRLGHSPTASAEGRPAQRNPMEEVVVFKTTRSASCPNPETLGLLRVPRPPADPPSPPASVYSPTAPRSPPEPRQNVSESVQVARRIGSVLSRLLRRDHMDDGGEGELHLYATSQTSRLYFHLQSSWNSFIIRSTLLLDPLHRRRCSASSDAAAKKLPVISWERTAHLYGQLTSELLQAGTSVESVYLLLQELQTAAHRNVALRRLFWRCSDVCVFLVRSLEESLLGRQNPAGVHTADQLLLSTLIVQTLAVMFRETDNEPARLGVLSAERGALTSRMLLAVICDLELQAHSQERLTDCELQDLRAEYADAACSLLFELLLLGHEASRFSSALNVLSVGWILRVLQDHPHLMSFMDFQARQVVLALSDPQGSVLSPAQSVLLFQRCRLLLACLQHSTLLAQHLQAHFREEFRYVVKLSCAEEKLPPHYPISQPTLGLVQQILTVVLHRNAPPAATCSPQQRVPFLL